MVEHGFQELVFEDAMEVIVDQLNALGTQDPLTIISLESNMRDGMLSNLVIMYMRMLTSCETQRRQDFFAPFIMVGVPDKRHHMFCTGMVSEQGQSCHCGADIGLCCAMPQPLGVADGFSLSQSRFSPALLSLYMGCLGRAMVHILQLADAGSCPAHVPPKGC